MGGKREQQKASEWVSEFLFRLNGSLAKRRSKDTALICECDTALETFLRDHRTNIPLTFWDAETKERFLRDVSFPSEETFAVIYAGRMLEETTRPMELLVELRKHLGVRGRFKQKIPKLGIFISSLKLYSWIIIRKLPMFF